MSNFVSKSCQGELCSMCGAPATRKVGEEILHDDPMPARHNLTAYVCDEHFGAIFSPRWQLNEADSAAFIAALENPPKPNQALTAAAARYKGTVPPQAPQVDTFAVLRLLQQIYDAKLLPPEWNALILKTVVQALTAPITEEDLAWAEEAIRKLESMAAGAEKNEGTIA